MVARVDAHGGHKLDQPGAVLPLGRLEHIHPLIRDRLPHFIASILLGNVLPQRRRNLGRRVAIQLQGVRPELRPHRFKRRVHIVDGLGSDGDGQPAPVSCRIVRQRLGLVARCDARPAPRLRLGGVLVGAAVLPVVTGSQPRFQGGELGAPQAAHLRHFDDHFAGGDLGHLLPAHVQLQPVAEPLRPETGWQQARGKARFPLPLPAGNEHGRNVLRAAGVVRSIDGGADQ